MEGAQAPGRKSSRRKGSERQVAEETPDYAALAAEGPQALEKEISRLEDAMFAAAKNLEFEEAGRLRDQINDVRNRLIALG